MGVSMEWRGGGAKKGREGENDRIEGGNKRRRREWEREEM